MSTPHPHRWLLLVTVAAGLLLVTLDNSVLTPRAHAHPRTARNGHSGVRIINAYPLVMAGLLLGTGTLGDRIGHRRMFLFGLVIFWRGVAGRCFLPTASRDRRPRISCRGGRHDAGTLALIRVTFDDERERNLAIAVWGSLSVVGAALGPIVGGLLLSHFCGAGVSSMCQWSSYFIGTLVFAPNDGWPSVGHRHAR